MRTSQQPTEQKVTPAAQKDDHSSIIHFADSSVRSAKETHETDFTGATPPSDAGTFTEYTSISDTSSPSPKTSKDLNPSPISSVADLTVLSADLKESKNALEYARIERKSDAQANLFFLHSFLTDPTTFNITAQHNIGGPLNNNRFARALEKTLIHQKAYQTCFFTDYAYSELKQGIVPGSNQDRISHFYSTTEDARKIFQTLATHT